MRDEAVSPEPRGARATVTGAGAGALPARLCFTADLRGGGASVGETDTMSLPDSSN